VSGGLALPTPHIQQGGKNMLLKIRALSLISGVILLTLLVAACGPTATPAPPTEAPTTEAPESEAGGTLRVGWTQEPDTLNPLVYETVQAGLIFREGLYETLVGVSTELEPEPLLAQSWEMEEEGRKWTFHLVEDAVWHDGEPFTAADVKFTIEYIKEYELPGLLSYVEAIKSVEAPDDYTVVIHYETPLATTLYDLQSVWIVPKHIWEGISGEEKGPLTFPNPNPIGTGPFKLVRWEKQQEFVLEANEDYWQGRPNLDRVVFEYFSNMGTMLLSLKEGTIDVIPWEIPPTAVDELKENPDIEVVMQPNLYYRWINFNVSGGGNPALAVKEVRQALNHAIDRQFLVDLIHQGYAYPGVQIIQKASPLWFNDQLEPYEFDLDLARSLLSEAGFEDSDGDGIRENEEGTELALTLLIINRWPEEVNAAEQIKSWWKEIGVDLTLQPSDAGTILGQSVPLTHDMYLWGFSGNPDPTFSLNIMLERQIGMWNGSGYANPEYDELFDTQKETMDQEERQRIIYQMQEIVQEDAPHAILYYMNAIGAYRSDKFTGFVAMPTGIMSQLNAHSLRVVQQVQE
jgi:peptide/nickel transport system substrate-binding protein